MQRRTLMFLAMGATAAITVVCFVMSDSPDKVYLNPMYVDILVLCAGVFLVADAFRRVHADALRSVVLTAIIGTAIVTIHVMQFAFDIARHRV